LRLAERWIWIFVSVKIVKIRVQSDSHLPAAGGAHVRRRRRLPDRCNRSLTHASGSVACVARAIAIARTSPGLAPTRHSAATAHRPVHAVSGARGSPGPDDPGRSLGEQSHGPLDVRHGLRDVSGHDQPVPRGRRVAATRSRFSVTSGGCRTPLTVLTTRAPWAEGLALPWAVSEWSADRQRGLGR